MMDIKNLLDWIKKTIMTDLWKTQPQQNGPIQTVEMRLSLEEQHAELTEQINIRGDMFNNLCDGSQMEQKVGKIQRE